MSGSGPFGAHMWTANTTPDRRGLSSNTASTGPLSRVQVLLNDRVVVISGDDEHLRPGPADADQKTVDELLSLGGRVPALEDVPGVEDEVDGLPFDEGREMVEHGTTHAVLEATSHGLAMHRLDGTEFDALFIRETTAVNHHTYRFARRAEREGLVVVDDPKSILRAANKVFLSELMDRHRIPQPKTMLIHRGNVKQIARELGFPCVLKQPDSQFSRGVIKVETEAELADLVTRRKPGRGSPDEITIFDSSAIRDQYKSGKQQLAVECGKRRAQGSGTD